MATDKTMAGFGMNLSNDIYHYEKGVHYLQLADWPSESLCLTRCGYHDCPSDYRWGPKSRPQYHMHFITEGSGTLRNWRKNIPFRKGTNFSFASQYTILLLRRSRKSMALCICLFRRHASRTLFKKSWV